MLALSRKEGILSRRSGQVRSSFVIILVVGHAFWYAKQVRLGARPCVLCE